jgi:hypothetical protein
MAFWASLIFSIAVDTLEGLQTRKLAHNNRPLKDVRHLPLGGGLRSGVLVHF